VSKEIDQTKRVFPSSASLSFSFGFHSFFSVFSTFSHFSYFFGFFSSSDSSFGSSGVTSGTLVCFLACF